MAKSYKRGGGAMTLDECITILTEHNKWRRGEPPYDAPRQYPYQTATEVGQAIDYAIEELHRLKGLEK